MKSKLLVILFVVINCIIIASAVFVLKPDWRIGGDGFGYYSYIRSAVFDHDFDFKNEYTEFDRFYGTHAATRFTPTGKVANLYSIGPSILISPFFAGAYFYDKSHPSENEYRLAGFGRPYQVAVFAAAVFYLLAGLLFLFFSLDLLFSRTIAIVVGTIAWLLSPLIFYVVYEPSMSHVFSFFTLSGLLFFCLWGRNNISRKDYVYMGLWLGLAMLVRWQNVIAVILPLAILFSNRLMYWTDKLKSLVYLLVTAFIVFIPQLLMWHYLFGAWTLIPQGNDFFDWRHPQIINFLISGWHGLFFWHPFWILGIIGLFLCFFRDKFLAFALLVLVAGQVYINSATIDWMAGRSFGARRMADYVFIFAIGLACIVASLDIFRPVVRRIIYAILIIGVVWNLGLLVGAGRGYINLDKKITIGEMIAGQGQSATFVWQQTVGAVKDITKVWTQKK